MKALIWISCFFVATILNTLLGYATGIKVGYLIFYFVVYFVAKKLCDKWDEHKSKEQSKPISVADGEENNNKINFCRKCGEPLIDNSKFCRKCGTEILIEVDNITPLKKCELCDKQTDNLFYYKINSDARIRYRNICNECVLKYGEKEQKNDL